MRRAAGDARVRWTTREQFHLTLRFLGNVEDQKLEPLTAALQIACRECGALQLRAEKIGFFPNPRSPRVVCSTTMGMSVVARGAGSSR